nr:uncharacterized protein LOC128684156 [Cherax quadricarinatus]XP_053626250.1 uncharacterized protein LOC128684156 [Cherax quadricarinatus]XP_053626251.1 uncharacterized protein LOC128684156 [Cherax quadricarinatus]
MSLFRMPRFLRRYIRRRTSHIPENRALRIKKNLSLLYAAVAWNLFGYIGYLVYSKRLEKINDNTELSPGRQYVKMLKLENVQLYHIDGLKSVEHFDLNKEFAEESQDKATSEVQEN